MPDRISKIAIVAPKMYPVIKGSGEHSFGGAEVALSLIANAISEEDGFQVHALVGDYGQPETEAFGRLTLHRAVDMRKGNLKNAISLLSALHRVDADVYIQRALALASPAIALYCRLRGRKFIYWIAHDSEADGGHLLYRNRLTGMLARSTFRMASHVIAQNNYEKEELERAVPGVRCSVIKKSVNLQHDATAEGQDIDAIWVGRCDEWKNPEAFIDLAGRFGGYCFVMVCPPAEGKADYHQSVRSRAAACDNLEFLGRTSHNDVLDLVARSRLFCITSAQEGDWPNVVMEAASLSKPILSLAINYDGLISQYGGGRYCDGDFSSFSREFGEMMDDPEVLARMGEGAYRYVSNEHELHKQTAKLIALINGLTADVSR